jgi:ATP-dependent DNA ligase
MILAVDHSTSPRKTCVDGALIRRFFSDLDGKAVACDDNGVASFDLVRHQRANARVFLYAFDLIEPNGDDLRRSRIPAG